MTKSDLRQLIRSRKAACPAAERDALSRAVVERLIASPSWCQAHSVLLYHSLPDEVDTHALIRQAAAEGKHVLLPVVVGDELELRPYSSDDDLTLGSFNILEPRAINVNDNEDERSQPPTFDKIDLAVIPGVAFTPDGRRLGRGRGYYDRLLVRLSDTIKVGICWPFQILPDIPTDFHDITMDHVITITLDSSRLTPNDITHLSPEEVFVFGSNVHGFHGGGAAAFAMRCFGAVWGQGEGLQGQSYAIPSMEGLDNLRDAVNRFVDYAASHPQQRFLVTRIGCGIAGYTPQQVAPLFAPCIPYVNIALPTDFWNVLGLPSD